MAERYFYTEKAVRNAKPEAKPYKMPGEGGMRLLVHPGGRKAWTYDYRYGDKRKTLTLGAYGNGEGYLSLADARRKRDEATAKVADGHDPAFQRKAARQARIDEHALTFESVAREWYDKQSWAPKHAKNILSRLEKDVFKPIGYKPIAQVKPRDIIGILQQIETRGALDVAKRINQYCVAIFDYAINLDLCETNPAQGRSKVIRSYTPKNRDHLKEAEIPGFVERLNADNYRHPTKLAVWLLALTIVRPGELRGARWDEFDMKKKQWVIPAERMKMKREHIVPLSAQAIDILRQLKALTGNNPLLFQGQKRYGQPISDVALIKAVRKYTGDKATPHGFRHTASTVLNEHGFNHDHIEKQLAHVEDNKVRGAYNKAEYLEQRTQMMQWWADFLEGSQNESANVVNIAVAGGRGIS
ncbi:MAG: integrase [Rickettsiales bacterium]|nr:integrase [Rickettsiales bacterium]